MSKLTEQQIAEIKKIYQEGDKPIRVIAEMYDVSRTTINRIVNPKYQNAQREKNKLRMQQNRQSYSVKRYPGLELNTANDADIIEKLDSTPNRQGYIKGLIRKDIQESPSDKKEQ